MKRTKPKPQQQPITGPGAPVESVTQPGAVIR